MALTLPKIFVSPGTPSAEEFEKAKGLLHADHRVTTIYELLTKDVKGVATSAVKMEVLAKTIDAEDFHEEYPTTFRIVKLKYQKALDQRKLLASSEYAIIKCLGEHLPHVCAKIIINYLEDSDLENLVKAVERTLNIETT